jgi:AcrR family transcriptional regulator
MKDGGIRKMTIEAVAVAAGVGKTTIYRWWPSKGLLALDAFEYGFSVLEPTAPPDTGSLRGDLTELIRPVLAARDSIAGRLGPQIIAEAQYDAELAEQIYSRLVGPYRRLQKTIFENAARGGEISSSFDDAMLLDALYGAYFHRVLLHHGELDQGFFDRLIDLLVTGAETISFPPSGGSRPKETLPPTERNVP